MKRQFKFLFYNNNNITKCDNNIDPTYRKICNVLNNTMRNK